MRLIPLGTIAKVYEYKVVHIFPCKSKLTPSLRAAVFYVIFSLLCCLRSQIEVKYLKNLYLGCLPFKVVSLDSAASSIAAIFSLEVPFRPLASV